MVWLTFLPFVSWRELGWATVPVDVILVGGLVCAWWHSSHGPGVCPASLEPQCWVQPTAVALLSPRSRPALPGRHPSCCALRTPGLLPVGELSQGSAHSTRVPATWALVPGTPLPMAQQRLHALVSLGLALASTKARAPSSHPVQGIEEIGVQVEEPFGILALEASTGWPRGGPTAIAKAGARELRWLRSQPTAAVKSISPPPQPPPLPARAPFRLLAPPTARLQRRGRAHSADEG